MVVYIETERLRLRDWEDKDLLPFQKMNANPQVRRYFPSLLSYRRSEIDMQRMDDILKEKGITEIYSFTSENNLPSRKVMEKIGMTFLDNFEFPNLNKYHPLKRHVRYYIELLTFTK